MMKLIIASLLCFVVTFATADPSPFGLEIGKASVSDLKQKYKNASLVGKSAYSGGDMYDIDPAAVDINGLQSVRAIFNKKNILIGITSEFSKERFNFLFKTMKSKKYKLVKKSIPFVGNATAEFRNGNTLIFLKAPHLSFSMMLQYLDKNFYKDIKKAQKSEAEQTRKAEQSKL